MVSLLDNALFLQSWRERMRFPLLASTIFLALIIIFLILTNAHINETYVYNYPQNFNYGQKLDYNQFKHSVPWLNKAFWDIAIGQGILILLFGSLSAYHVTNREKQSGTIEFHRSSPAPRFEQVIGLLFGAPILEWVLFGGTLIVSFIIALASEEITLLTFLKFYTALILSAIYIHLFVILLGISTDRVKNRLGMAQIIFVLWFVFGLSGYVNNSAVAHATWTPAYEQLNEKLHVTTAWRHTYNQQQNLRNTFLNTAWPSFLLQLLVQVPLLIFFSLGIIRKISHPERSISSKVQFSAFCIFIFFLFFGSNFYELTSPSGYLYAYYDGFLSMFMSLVLILGFLGAWQATPTYLLYVKGLRRLKKLNLKQLNPDEDFSDNTLWLITFGLATTVVYALLGFLLHIQLKFWLLSLITLLSFVWFFAKALEYFQLSKYHMKKSYFWTTFIVLWAILPIFGSITQQVIKSTIYYYLVSSASPFMSIGLMVQEILRYSNLSRQATFYSCIDPFSTNKFSFLAIVFSVNLILCIIATYLAHQEKKRHQQIILK